MDADRGHRQPDLMTVGFLQSFLQIPLALSNQDLQYPLEKLKMNWIKWELVRPSWRLCSLTRVNVSQDGLLASARSGGPQLSWVYF